MAWDPLTRAEIRDTLLAEWNARYLTETGDPLDITEGSEWYQIADAFGLILEHVEAQGAQVAKEILPDQASEAGVLRHGDVEGVEREAAVAAQHTVTITGTPSAVVSFGSSVLVSTGNLNFTPSANPNGTGTSVTLSGAGSATIYVRCQTAGAAGNLSNGAVLTWSSTPTNANPTGTVTGTTITGVNQESVGDYARRIIEHKQERPASGNRADWRKWVETFAGVKEAYVYPLYSATQGPETLGCVTVIPLGPAQGNAVDNSRVLGGATISNIASYIEGVVDKDGGATGELKQLRPVTIKQGNYSIEAPLLQAENITLDLRTASAYPFSFTGTHTILGTPTPTTTTFSVTGDVSSLSGKNMLVAVGTANARGSYVLITPTAVYNSGAGRTDFTVTTPMQAAPSGTIYPAPYDYTSIRDAVFAYFDGLGPGDVDTGLYPGSARWPTPDVKGPSVLYRSALAAAVIGKGGVIDATVFLPAANTTPPAKTLITLGVLTIRKA